MIIYTDIKYFLNIYYNPLVKIIAEKLDIPCINFSDLVDCSIENKYKSNICASAVSIAQLNRISQIK